jgi:hypothetical protein
MWVRGSVTEKELAAVRQEPLREQWMLDLEFGPGEFDVRSDTLH